MTPCWDILITCLMSQEDKLEKVWSADFKWSIVLSLFIDAATDGSVFFLEKLRVPCGHIQSSRLLKCVKRCMLPVPTTASLHDVTVKGPFFSAKDCWEPPNIAVNLLLSHFTATSQWLNRNWSILYKSQDLKSNIDAFAFRTFCLPSRNVYARLWWCC